MLRRFCSLAGTAFASAVFVVASSQTAGADSITFVTVNLGCIPNASGPNACPDPEEQSDGDYTFLVDGFGQSLEVTDENDGFADANFDYSAAAAAEFGILHARASGTFSGLTPNAPTSIRTAVAFAAVTDLLTITAPGQSGTATLDVSFLLSGTFQRDPGAGAFALAGAFAGQSPDPFDGTSVGEAFDSILVVPSGPLTASVPFTWGQPFYLTLIMGVGAGTPVSCAFCVDSGDSNPTPTPVADGSASADFFNTLVLSALVPRDNDALNTRVLNAQYAADSGAVYSIDGIVAQPVPEPGSLLLLGTGFALAVKRRRRG